MDFISVVYIIDMAIWMVYVTRNRNREIQIVNILWFADDAPTSYYIYLEPTLSWQQPAGPGDSVVA